MAVERRQDIDLGIVRYEYGDAARAQRAVLTIDTGKYYNGGLISSAVVYWVGTHSRQNCVGLGGDGGDYWKRLLVSAKGVRATQKNIDGQHQQAFTPEVIAGLVTAAKAHYAAAVKAGVDGFHNTYPNSEVGITPRGWDSV